MTSDSDSFLIPIREFVASKQTILFQSLKQRQFNGQMILTDNKRRATIFYLYLGRLTYATGGYHTVRRWRRNVSLYAPELIGEFANLQKQVNSLVSEGFKFCWEYDLLCLWVQQDKITREQAIQIIKGILVEIFFDLTQAMQVTYQLKTDKFNCTPLVLIDTDQIIVEAWKNWQSWQGAKLADKSPNSAPIIKQPEQLRLRTSPHTYEAMSKILEGKRTLRDLEIQTRQNIEALTRSLLPYIQLGLIELINIPDLASPYAKDSLPPLTTNKVDKHYLIACVDDSPLICNTLEQIITKAGYRYISIIEPIRAIAFLLGKKPDLIFLDIILGSANGYEICAQLRKLSIFNHTPIILLTGNLNLFDRMKAKMAGSTDCLLKPLDADSILETIKKYLPEH